MKITVQYIPTEFTAKFWYRDYMKAVMGNHMVRTSWLDIDGFIVKE